MNTSRTTYTRQAKTTLAILLLAAGAAITFSLLLGRGQERGQQLGRFAGPGFFEQPIEAVGSSPRASQEAALLMRAVLASPGQDDAEVGELFASFAAENPTSVWTPSLQANLGRHFFEEGRYTKALELWERAWESTKSYPSGPGKRVADYCLARWTRVLVGLGRLEEVELILAETRGRLLDGGPLQQKFLRTAEMCRTLRRTPTATYRCGWMVLNELSKQQGGRGLDRVKAEQFYREANLFQSCSMKSLSDLARDEQIALLGVERPDGSEVLPIPSVMHLRQGHYVALLASESGQVLAYDPLFGTRRFRPQALNAEASGRFLVGATMALAGWRSLSNDEMATTVGRCPGWFGGYPDLQEGSCDSCGEDCPAGLAGEPNTAANPVCLTGGCSAGQGDSIGMPSWRVTEPNINVWLRDTPITCQGAYGPAVPLNLMYKQRDDVAGQQTDVFGFGAGWNSRWLSYVQFSVRFGVLNSAILYLPGGGAVDFSFPIGVTTATDYYYNIRITAMMNGGIVSGFTVDYPDGRQNIYQQPWKSNFFYMTTSLDQQGFGTQYEYGQVGNPAGLRLQIVKDQTGSPLYNIAYTSGTLYPHLISGVTSRFGQTALFTYAEDDNGFPHLRQIQDAAGLTSTVEYNDLGWPVTLTTPYGQTTFSYQWTGNMYTDYRWVDVTEPNGGRQVYLFDAACSTLLDGQTSWLPQQFPAGLVPGGVPGGTQLDNSPYWLNSFHWNQQQSQNLPTDPTLLTVAQMNKARMRHWLCSSDFSISYPDLALSFEMAPSTDANGATQGQITWYDYAGKPSPGERGTQIQPSLVSRLLPDGSTWYESYQRNGFGRATTKISTYGTANPPLTRAYTYTYAANNQDLQEARRPGNELVASYTYNGRHQVLTETRWPDDTHPYTDTYVYDTQGRVQTKTTAGGLTRTYSYETSSDNFPGYLSGISDQPVSRTESFTWHNGSVRTHTDARGLTRTFTRDGLNRLVQIDFPAHDGLAASTIQYSYVLGPGQGFNNTQSPFPILDRTAMKDRLDKWTYYERDRLGRVSKVQDPLNHSTSYTYCGCGGPESVTDARNKVTIYSYNNAGWKTATLYADNTTETLGYDALGRMTTRGDSLGSRTMTYNNQGLLIGVTSAFGTEKSVSYNIYDQPETDTDANGVAVSKTFDRLGRVLTRTVPGQAQETFIYSARGLTDYTGPDGKLTHYAYDAALRKTGETTPKNETTSYTYNAAGDLLTLTDGRNKVTTWTYDVEGLVRTKTYHGQSFANLQYSYDVNQRLAWRKFWSSPSSSKQTSYTYDDAGNLHFIDYPTSPDITFNYDELNQMTSMVTVGLGTTTFTYTDAHNPSGEYGLWASDAVSLTYHASAPRLQTGLTLQQPAGSWGQTYAYDAARRLQTLTSPAGQFTYTYRGPGTFWTNLALPTLPNSAAITNAYDSGGRLTRTALRSSAGVILNAHDYLYNTGGQRQRQTLTDGRYTTYGYDNDAQLASSLGYTSGGSPVAAEQLGFVYDGGWNMTQRSVNGSPATYTVNDLNEVTAAGGASYTYDANGNRTTGNSGHNVYVYDDENRLIQWFSYTNNQYSPVSGDMRTDFQYDGLGRLRVRSEYSYYQGGQAPQGFGPLLVAGWNLGTTTHYLYDGKRVIQERDGSNTPLGTYTRGKDLSGSLEGAGGTGGLLARSSGYSGGNWSTHNFYHADGNGNITYMVNSSQAMVANYRYDPYGRTITSSGTLANQNVYRFSSKEAHDRSGLYYYLYRFYDPSVQRWVNRDPINEMGSRLARGACNKCYRLFSRAEDVYRFCENNPATRRDAFGLVTQEQCEKDYRADLAALQREGAACLRSAIVWGLWGEVILGGGGACVGAFCGGPPGAGVGLLCGTVGNAVIDSFHYSHCMEQVAASRQWAERLYNYCLSQATD